MRHVLIVYLFATVDAVLAEDGGAPRGHPHSGQCVAVNLVLLDHSLAFLVLEKHRVDVKHKADVSHQPSVRCVSSIFTT